MYTTRFAPTPSGPLHFGSLSTLLGAWLRARSQGGRILLRIEDLDTPRCPREMAQRVLGDIKAFGFDFDGEVLFQSERIPFYESEISRLCDAGLAFECSCTRQSLKHSPCRCFERAAPLPPGTPRSIRFKPKEDLSGRFRDALLGDVDTGDTYGFLTLRRSDGIISYNLACVADDIDTGVTEVVRGQDLMYVTPRQEALAKALGCSGFAYLHLPLALASPGLKLSKQNHAPAITDAMTPARALLLALSFLGQDTSWAGPDMACREILAKAADRFDLLRVPRHGASAPDGAS
ncbi:MAG: tRNA glutamyl-Q(34) synthetase GluQRS [Succinivibrio sp.]